MKLNQTFYQLNLYIKKIANLHPKASKHVHFLMNFVITEFDAKHNLFCNIKKKVNDIRLHGAMYYLLLKFLEIVLSRQPVLAPPNSFLKLFSFFFKKKKKLKSILQPRKTHFLKTIIQENLVFLVIICVITNRFD